MSNDIKKKTKGNHLNLQCEDGRVVFIAGDEKRVLLDEVFGGKGVAAVNGLVRLADGTELYAVS